MNHKQNELFQTWINKPVFDKFSSINKGNFEKGIAKVYNRASKILEIMELNPGCPLKSIIDVSDIQNNEIFRLINTVSARNEEIKYIINKIGRLKFEDMSLAECKILIAEMLWGRQILINTNLHIQTMRYHEETIRDLYLEVINVIDNPVDHDKCKFPTYVRINTLAISIEDAINAFYKEGWNLLPRSKSYANYSGDLANLRPKDFIRDYHISELLAFPPGTSFLQHPGYLSGKFLVQDKGSCLSSFLLNPKLHSIVLDATAAPGLKTNHLANIMNNTGRLYANDVHKERLKMLHQLIDITSVTNTFISQDNFFNFSRDKDEIEYVLVDPSTSYSGIFLLANKQNMLPFLRHSNWELSFLLKYALQTFPNVKRVVYTACSIHPEEGERVVDTVLEEIGDSFTLLDAKQMLWDEWHSMGLPEYKCGKKCIRIHPEYDQCQGWFIAVFERNFDVPVPPFKFKGQIESHNIFYKKKKSISNCIDSSQQTCDTQQPTIAQEKNEIPELQLVQNKAEKVITITNSKKTKKRPNRKHRKTLKRMEKRRLEKVVGHNGLSKLTI